MKLSGGLDTIQAYNRESYLSRRGFVRLAATGAATLAAAGALAGSTGCNSAVEGLTGEREVVDDAGRTVMMPAPSKLERIYFTSALAQIFCFTLKPDLLAGTGITFTADELELLPPLTSDLPYLGTLSGGGEIDREALLVEDVQVVFSISGVPLTQANISEADDLMKMTNIPTILIDGSFERIADAYRLLGYCLGQEERAEEIGIYCEERYAQVTAAVAGLRDDEKISLYYAEGPEGLQTEPAESQHALTFVVGGAYDVATVAIGSSIGMSNVSLEQVLLWDPEVIIAWDDVVRGGADEDIRTNPDWSDIRAVKDGRVYTMPNVPFAWCDRPPGVNRLIGIQWIANLLYPDLYDVDMVEITKEFYSKMYWVDIDDDKAREILGNSYPPPARVIK